MYKIIFLDEASYDYIWIWEFIALDNLFYSKEVLDKIDKSIDILSDFPLIWKDLDWVYRQIVEPNYKFKIVYKIDNETIYIVAIYREQEKW
jgi:plasmid stabilization system protein ParE